MKHILFVCTGNTCRSPMAEGIFRDMAAREGLRIEIQSAGVSAFDGTPISHNSMAILREKGIDEALSSNAISGELVSWADLILTMTMNHKQAVIQKYPEAIDKTFTLKEYVEDDPLVLANIIERGKAYSELQVKQALSQHITNEEREQLLMLEFNAPDFDIADPFGRSMEDYKQCARDIGQSLDKLLRKLING